MIVSGLLAFMYSNFYYQQKLKPQNDEKNTVIALNIAEYIEENPHIDLEDYLSHLATVGYQFLVLDEQGEEQFFGAPFRDKTLPSQTKDSVLKGEFFHGILEFPKETFITGFFSNELMNTIGVPVKQGDQSYALFMRPDIKMLFNEMHMLFAWILIVTVALSIIFVLVGAKYLIHPISKLTRATKELSEGSFSIQLDIDRDDEIGNLASSFTNMAQQLKKLDQMKNEFMSNVTHDLQSPLANIKGYVNLLENENLSVEERANYISIITSETNRLSILSKQLLLLSSLEQEDGFVHKNLYNLSEQLKEAIYNNQWLIQERNLMVSYSLKDINIFGDSSLLYNVWENLLTNAIKYNVENGEIKVTLEEKLDFVYVSFTDTGVGFSQEAKEKIFDRFYREDKARTRSIEGSGLGLSIVEFIVKLHDGEIMIESEKGKGSSFIIKLPREA